jgi:hypothetical protein
VTHGIDQKTSQKPRDYICGSKRDVISLVPQWHRSDHNRKAVSRPTSQLDEPERRFAIGPILDHATSVSPINSIAARGGHLTAFYARLGESPVSDEEKIVKLNSMYNRIFNVGNFAISFNLLVLSAGMGPALTAGARAQALAEPHTATAVIADDEGWSKAEEAGDTKYVDALLLPEYRSISSDGSTHGKAAILAHTAKGGNNGEGTAKAEQWRAAHPHRASVEMNGDVAILTFALDKGVDLNQVMSCDIFVYRDGRWRALYSQHTEAEK